MSLGFKWLGCFHVQRSQPLHLIAMEIDVHRYPQSLTDESINQNVYFFNQDLFKFVKNYFWPLLYSQYIHPNEYKAQSQKCVLHLAEQCESACC